MAAVKVTIPGTAGLIEAEAEAMSRAVAYQFNLLTAPIENKPRPPSAGDLGIQLKAFAPG